MPLSNSTRIPVWDLAIRLFHWLLVLLIMGLMLTGLIGGFDITVPLPVNKVFFLNNMDVHMYLGQSVLALVLFRLFWGVAGSSTARFSAFVRGPRAVFAYCRALLRGEVPAATGHNPAGAAMIVAMLVLLLAQAGTGLFAHDDTDAEGPLAHLVSTGTSDFLSNVHGVVFYMLLLCIILHVSAIFYYWWRGENLVMPMLNGSKPVDLLPVGAPLPVMASLGRAVVLMAIAVALVCGLHFL
jgi:cytochrome b